MKKIPCLFERDFTDKRHPVLLRTVTPGCEWALAGEGRATRKRDGTACLVQDGRLFKRYDAKRGKTPPVGFIPCGEPDPVTGHHPGWVEVGDEPESKWHREAWTGLRASDGSRFRPQLYNTARGEGISDGTYELCGPKLQGNPEQLEEHKFIRHGAEYYDIADKLSWEGLRWFLSHEPIEGIVFHHPDGRMCKIRRADYGFDWPLKPCPVQP